MNSGTDPSRIPRYLHLLQCPQCRASLGLDSGKPACLSCGHRFPLDGDLPLLFWAPEEAAAGNVTERIQAFYEQTPFPDYEEFDDLASLLEKARTGVFARLLDEQIPFGARILEAGCGTGQLSNFLGIAHRTVIGTDLCVNSLRLAEAFRGRHVLERVFFAQMNLFHPVFDDQSFDFVICNGVLHHTADPRAGFARLARLVRPGGYLIVGLYHRYGRLMTDLRRLLFRAFGPGLAFLDPRLRKAKLGSSRRTAWFADQYQNPHESKHTIAEVLEWLEPAGLVLTRSIPSTQFLRGFDADVDLFAAEPAAGRLERALKERLQALAGSDEGGFFTIIARKR